jgi:hypothetical protein
MTLSSPVLYASAEAARAKLLISSLTAQFDSVQERVDAAAAEAACQATAVAAGEQRIILQQLERSGEEAEASRATIAKLEEVQLFSCACLVVTHSL